MSPTRRPRSKSIEVLCLTTLGVFIFACSSYDEDLARCRELRASKRWEAAAVACTSAKNAARNDDERHRAGLLDANVRREIKIREIHSERRRRAKLAKEKLAEARGPLEEYRAQKQLDAAREYGGPIGPMPQADDGPPPDPLCPLCPDEYPRCCAIAE